MSLTDKERIEIKAVVKCLEGLQGERLGSLATYHAEIARKCASSLRALLLQPESLEDVCEKIIEYTIQGWPMGPAWKGSEMYARLRAALEHRRKERGK